MKIFILFLIFLGNIQVLACEDTVNNIRTAAKNTGDQKVEQERARQAERKRLRQESAKNARRLAEIKLMHLRL